jgi:hypothetical protein
MELAKITSIGVSPVLEYRRAEQPRRAAAVCVYKQGDIEGLLLGEEYRRQAGG